MKEFIKNKYNIIIPVFLLIVLLIALLLYTKEYKNNRYANVNDVEVYQYFSGIKVEYIAKISRNKKNVILDFENTESVVSLDSTPIYVKDKDSVIFPKEMCIMFPFDTIQYQVNALAEVYKNNNLYYLNIRNFDKNLDHAFYYDGNNLYFFIDEVELIVGDKSVKLSPMSYVNASYLNFVEYYDKDSDTFEIIEVNNEDIIVRNDYMTIDVGSDKVIYNNSFYLLGKDFSFFKKITDMDDKKGSN